MQLEGRLVSEVVEGGHAEQEEEDEDDDGILPAPVQPNQNLEREDNGVGGVELPQLPQANAVEDDEDDESLNNLRNNISSSSVTNAVPIDGTNESIRSESPIHASNSNMSTNSSTNYNPLIIPLSHPPEAVKLLLEYCYTNRVLPLGYEAFQKSYRKPDLNKLDALLHPHVGPVGPYPPTFGQGSRAAWSNGGKPTVSLSVALAGIRLAEEAELPRLSLMCEIAASQLVSAATLLESLALCEESKRGKCGNGLSILRRAVMQHVLAHGARGVADLAAMPSFQRGLQERGDVVVPSLLTGVAEAIKIGGKGDGGKRKGKKSDFAEERTKSANRKRDEDDAIDRSKERARWRKERWSKRAKFSSHNNTGSVRNPYNLEVEPAEETVPHTIILNDDGDVFQVASSNTNNGNSKARGSKSFRSQFSAMFGGNGGSNRHLVAADRGVYGFREVRGINSGTSSSITTATTSGAVTKNSSSRSRKRGR